MRFLRRLVTRTGFPRAGQGSDARLREELEDHIARQTEENLRAGMFPQEARRQAILKFGPVVAVRESYHAEQRLPFFETLLRDLRFALRIFVKSPGFAAVAILTMALGIGATTAIFSVVDATLLHALPYPHPGELVRLQDDLPGIGARDVGITVPEWKDLQRSGVFQSVAIIGGGSVNLTGSSQPERILFLNVTPNYFAMLGVGPQLGHLFDPQDQTPGFTLEAVLSDGLWKRAFGGDPGILGKNLRLDNDLYHVIGITPAGFHDPGRTPGQRNTDIWLASGFAAAPAPPPLRSPRIPLEMVARLAPGLSLATAQSRIDALVASLEKQYPADYPLQSQWTVRLIPLQDSIVGNIRQSLFFLLGAVVLVLLIGCVNVANLLLARAGARTHEIAIRQAIGATGTRLMRQLITESLLLSLLGAAAGLALLFLSRGLLLRIIPDSLPRLNSISLNWTVLLFALGVSLLSGIVFGFAPAWTVGRVNLMHALRQEGRGSRGSVDRAQTRRIFVISEFAFSLVLMIAAGLLLRSFWDLYKVQPGFHPENVMAVQVWLPVPNDPATDIYGTPAQESRFLREVLRRTGSLSGVEEVAASNLGALPLGHAHNDLNQYPLIREGRETPAGQAPIIHASDVTPGYFHLLGFTLLRGRLFTDQETDTMPPVAVISESMARTWWPNEDPVGKRFNLNPAKPKWFTIVGIVADARSESLEETGSPQIYLDALQRRPRDLTIYLRGQFDVGAIPALVRQQVQSVDPTLPVFGGQTLTQTVADSLSVRRFTMELIVAFAAIALLLAALGIYGVISCLVNDSIHDIGIRLALGAQRPTILGMVLRQGLGLVVTGSAVGLLAALLVSRLMSRLLFGVSPADPLTFTGVPLVLALVALAACSIPAWRATRVDPLTALRHE